MAYQPGIQLWDFSASQDGVKLFSILRSHSFYLHQFCPGLHVVSRFALCYEVNSFRPGRYRRHAT